MFCPCRRPSPFGRVGHKVINQINVIEKNSKDIRAVNILPEYRRLENYKK